MIRTEREYQESLCRLEELDAVVRAQRDRLQAEGLGTRELELALEPVLSFRSQIEEEVEQFVRIRGRDFGTLSSISQLGQLLIALRIANGLTQHDLAERLGVSEAQVSRDERNEYHRISVERAQRIIDALGERVVLRVEGSAA